MLVELGWSSCVVCLFDSANDSPFDRLSMIFLLRLLLTTTSDLTAALLVGLVSVPVLMLLRPSLFGFLFSVLLLLLFLLLLLLLLLVMLSALAPATPSSLITSPPAPSALATTESPAPTTPPPPPTTPLPPPTTTPAASASDSREQWSPAEFQRGLVRRRREEALLRASTLSSTVVPKGVPLPRWPRVLRLFLMGMDSW